MYVEGNLRLIILASFEIASGRIEGSRRMAVSPGRGAGD
jgi:hypothetical protein